MNTIKNNKFVGYQGKRKPFIGFMNIVIPKPQIKTDIKKAPKNSHRT